MQTEVATNVLIRIEKVSAKHLEMTAHDEAGNWLMSSQEPINAVGVRMTLKRCGIIPISRPYYKDGCMCINGLKFTTVNTQEEEQ